MNSINYIICLYILTYIYHMVEEADFFYDEYILY